MIFRKFFERFRKPPTAPLPKPQPPREEPLRHVPRKERKQSRNNPWARKKRLRQIARRSRQINRRKAKGIV